MAPGTRRRAIARNPFVAPSLLRDFNCSKMFFVCEDLLLFFERLKAAPGDDEFDDPESFVQYIQDSPTRTCNHSHLETCVVVLYLCLPDMAEILYPQLNENVRQQLALYPRLSPRRFIQLLRFGELGDAFVAVIKSCRLSSRMELVGIVFAREEFEALSDTQAGADDLVYFLQHAVKAALPGRIPLDLRDYCQKLMTCERAKLSIGLLLAESLAVVMNEVVERLSKSTRPGNFAGPLPSTVVQKMFKPAAASLKACGWNDSLEFLVGLLASAVGKDKRLCDEMMRLSFNDRIVDFALNCCDAATEAGLIDLSINTRAYLTSMAKILTPSTLHVRRILGADSYDSLKMLKDAPKAFYRDAIFLELLRNRKTYLEKDGLFLVEVLDATLVDGRKLTCYEAVLIVVSLLNVPPAVQTVEKIMGVMREMNRVELMMFLASFLLLRDVERYGNRLRTEGHGKKMVALWNRVTESTLHELLPDFMVAAFVDPRGTVERAVDSASEKAGKIDLSCKLLARLRPICCLTLTDDDVTTSEDQEFRNEAEGDVGDADEAVDEDYDATVHEWSLLTDVMYKRIQALSTSPPNVWANLTSLAYRLVKDDVLLTVEAYVHLVRPVFEAIVEDFEIGALACRILEAILEDEAVRRGERLAEYTLWDVLKFVWIAHQDVLDFKDSGEDGCEDEPVLHLEEKLYGLKKILVGLLSDASDEEWWKFCADAAMMARLNRFLPMASLCCFNNDDDEEDSESRGTVGGIVREYHKVTYMRDEDGICLKCKCASCERPFNIATLELAVALNYCQERDVDRFLTRSLRWPASLGETGTVLSSSLSRIDELVHAWSVGTEVMQERHAKTLMRPLLESFRALLAKLPGLESPESERLLGVLAIGFLERVAAMMDSWCSSALENAFVQRALLDMWTAFLDCEQMAELVTREQVEETFVAFWLPLLDKIDSRDKISKAVDEMLLRIQGTT